MKNRKIVYINQQQIPDIVANSIKKFIPDYNQEIILKSLQLTNHQSFYNRAGFNSLPFVSDTNFNPAMPCLDKKFSKSFEEVTDQRCLNVMDLCQGHPIIVLWSGGIDSTVIVSSLIKNLSKKQLDNITVSCNSISVFENPVFFRDHIVPNFKIINSTCSNLHNQLGEHYVIDGNPADLLQGSGLALHAKTSGLALDQDWKISQGALMDFLTRQVGRDAAEWLYGSLEKNLLDTDERCQIVETLADWFWWINFNWKWLGDCWHGLDAQRMTNMNTYFSRYINWFDAKDYQQWSISQGRYSLITDGISLGDYKKSSKKYIYDLDRNDYYLRFKLKCHSTAQVASTKSWLCMLDDFTTLSVEKDLDQILKLLPTHLNAK